MEKEREIFDFAFITNTRSKELDWSEVYGKSFNLSDNFVPPDIFEWQKINCIYKNKQVSGVMIIIGSTAADILKDISHAKKAKKQISDSIEYAINKLKVRTIGFGASTKRLPSESDLKKYRDKVIFTHGDSLTAAVCLEEIKGILKILETNLLSEETKIMIIGAYGTLGFFLSDYFAKNYYKAKIFLVGRNILKLKKTFAILPKHCELYSNLSDINSEIDLIITTTNHPESILSENDLCGFNWPVVFDPAQPPNFDLNSYKKCGKKILRIDGAIVVNSGLKYDSSKGKMPLETNEAFACLAETILLAQLSHKKFELVKNCDLMQKIDFEISNFLFKMFWKKGWVVNPFKNFGEIISGFEIQSKIKK